MMKLDISGKMVYWSIELNDFDLNYMPRTMIKAQALVDFVFEQPEEDHKSIQRENLQEWIIYVDGLSNSEGNRVGLILKGPNGYKIKYAL